MMKALKYLMFCLMLGLGGATSAQDFHFTMFDLTPINLNPGYTGLYAGTFRVGGNYRSQWQGMGINPISSPNTTKFLGFKTPAAYIDVPFGIRRKDNFGELRNWMGAGINFYNDQVGQLSTLRAELSVAYHIGFGQRANTRLSIGVKGGISQLRIKDFDQFIFERDLDGSGSNPDLTNFQQSGKDAVTAPDFSAGLVFTHKGHGWGMQIGGSANHLSQPKVNFLFDDFKLPMHIIGTARFDFALGQKVTLRPLFFMQYMASVINMNAQGVFAFHFNTTKDANLLVGGGYRFNDAAFARIGFEFKGLSFGAAYDFNLSTLSSGYSGANARAMGFELGLAYIAKIYKELKVDDILYNPRF